MVQNWTSQRFTDCRKFETGDGRWPLSFPLSDVHRGVGLVSGQSSLSLVKQVKQVELEGRGFKCGAAELETL